MTPLINTIWTLTCSGIDSQSNSNFSVQSTADIFKMLVKFFLQNAELSPINMESVQLITIASSAGSWRGF